MDTSACGQPEETDFRVNAVAIGSLIFISKSTDRAQNSTLPAHMAKVSNTWPGITQAAKRLPPLTHATTHLLNELLLTAISAGTTIES